MVYLLSYCRQVINSFKTNPLNIMFDDCSKVLLGNMIDFSCLYLPQGHWSSSVVYIFHKGIDRVQLSVSSTRALIEFSCLYLPQGHNSISIRICTFFILSLSLRVSDYHQRCTLLYTRTLIIIKGSSTCSNFATTIY